MNYDTNTRQPLHDDSHGDGAQPGPADGTEGVQRDGGASKDRPVLRGVLSLGLTVLMAGAGVTLLAIAGARLIPVARGDLIEANSGAAVEVLTDVTHALTQDIERLTVPAMQRGQKLAQSDDLIDAVRDNNTQRITDLCNQAIQHATEIDAITVFDAEGEIVAINTVYRDGTVIPDDRIAQIMTRDYSARGIIMQCVKNSSRQEILEFQIDCDITPALFDSSGLAVAHSVPLYDRSGTRVGVVSTHMRFDRITSLIQGRSFAGGEGSIWFVTDDGRYFDEQLNAGGDPPVPHDDLRVMTQPLVNQATEYVTFDRGGATHMLYRVSDLNTMEDGGIQVMTRVPDSWLTREARNSALVGVVTPGAGGVLFLVLAIMNGMWMKMRGQRDAARKTAKQLKTYERNLKDSLAEAKQVAEELSATRKVMDKHTLFSIADRAGKIIDVNEGFCKISGYSREELLGQDHRMLNSGYHPKSFWKDMWRTLQSGKPWRGEVCNRAKDGSLYWVDSTNIPQVDEHGKIIRYVSLRFDITERKRLETQIEAARNQFESLVGNIPGITYRCRLDEQWTMMYMSDAVEQLTGYPVEEFIDNQTRSYESVILPDDSTRVAEAVQQGVEAGNSWDIEYRIRHRNGDVRWVHEKGSYIAGEQPFLDGFILDITDRVEARQRLSSIYEALSEGIVLLDTRGTIVDCNPAAEQVLGIGTDEILGRSPRDPRWRAIREDGSELPSLEAPAMRTLMTGEAVQEFVHGIVQPDGQTSWLSISSQPIHDQAGELNGVVASMTDITEQYQQRREIETQKRMLEAALDSPATGFWDWKIHEGVEYYSTSWLDMLGYEPGELPETPDTWQELIHPEDLEQVMETYAAHVESKGQEPYYNKVRYRHKDGSTVWVLCIGRVVEWSADGEPLRMTGCHIDVTEAQEAELRIREVHHELAGYERQMRLFVEHTPAAVAMLDKEMRYMLVSQGWIEQYGLEDTDILGRTHYEVFPTIPQRWKDIHQRVLNGEHLQNDRDSFEAEDGSKIWVSWNMKPWYTPDGEVGGVVMFTQVINKQIEHEQELEQAKEQAEQASKSKSEFLANMSHEIRTPMAAILGYSDLLGSELADDPDQAADAVRTIQSNANHLLTIINDILDVSKIEAGQMAVEAIETSPTQIISEVLSLVRPRATGKGVDVGVIYQTPIPVHIQSDPTRLRQILLNLMGNAIKFTEVGSVTIHASCDTNSQQLKLSVVDTGIGMSPEQCEVISKFDAFSQADASTTRKFGGTGLGLRISNALAQMLGGGIEVSSVQGQGSTFTATIATGNLDRVDVFHSQEVIVAKPQKPTKTQEEATAQPATGKPLQGLRVLLAEDGPDNQRLISFHLKKAGADVTICENGRIAVEALENMSSDQLPSVVLMDMQMPELDGYSATRRLRDQGFKIPIIALTAHAMEGDRQKCVDAGCDEYLTKPIDKEQLIESCMTWALNTASGNWSI